MQRDRLVISEQRLLVIAQVEQGRTRAIPGIDGKRILGQRLLVRSQRVFVISQFIRAVAPGQPSWRHCLSRCWRAWEGRKCCCWCWLGELLSGAYGLLLLHVEQRWAGHQTLFCTAYRHARTGRRHLPWLLLFERFHQKCEQAILSKIGHTDSTWLAHRAGEGQRQFRVLQKVGAVLWPRPVWA